MESVGKSFQANLKSQLEAKSKLTPREKKMLGWLTEPSTKGDKKLAKLEDHARKHVGVKGGVPVDWSAAAIDWKTLLPMLLEFLMKLLPLLFLA